MNVQVIRSISDLHIGKNEWNSLVLRDVTSSVFQTYEWFECWWKAFETRGQPLILIARDVNDTIIGIASLIIVQERTEKTVRFCGYNNADYCDFIAPGDKTEIVKLFLSTLMLPEFEWDRVLLFNLSEVSPTSRIVREFCKENQYIYSDYPSTPAPYLDVKASPDAVKRIVKKYSVVRRYRALKKKGELVFRTLNGGEIYSYLPVLFEQHIARWSTERNGSLFNDEHNRVFYTELACMLSKTSWGSFTVLECDGKPVGLHYGFVFNNKMIWYKPTFDMNYSKFSPGIVLIKYLIEDAVRNNLDELDFTIGDEPFKGRFTTDVRCNNNIVIFRGRLNYLFVMAGRRLRGLLKLMVAKMGYKQYADS